LAEIVGQMWFAALLRQILAGGLPSRLHVGSPPARWGGAEPFVLDHAHQYNRGLVPVDTVPHTSRPSRA